MPLTAKGEKIKAALEKTYGSGEKAKQVLYAGQNKGIFTGIDDAAKEAMDELETARAIAAGELSSPQLIGNLSLYAMRVSGTGVSYRRGLDEFVWRDPALYLSQDMIDRCAGLPVIMEHPKSNTLNSDEFADRVVGGCMFGYVKDDELWCIARIYDDEVVEMMEKDQLSTSPAVVFKDPSVNNKITLDGKTLLIEGKPSLLDHLAICERGVWDKGGDPTGIDVVNRKDSAMTEEEKKVAADKARHDAEEKEKEETSKADAAKIIADASTKLDAVLAHLDSLGKRMDAYDAKADAVKAKADEDEEEEEKKKKEEKERDDKAKKDAVKAKAKKDEWDEKEEEKEEKGDPKKLAADKAKKDDEIVSGNKTKVADATKAKKDDWDEKEEKEKKEKDDAARKDAHFSDMQKQIADLQAKMPKQRSDKDFAAIADAQTYWDKAYSGFSQDAPRPWEGETTLGYRRRCAKEMRHHSPNWKDSDLDVVSIDAAAFKLAESQIYADSLRAADDPVNIPEDTLIERVNIDRMTGQRSISFHGSPSAWTNQFKSGKQYVSRFGKRDNG